LLVLRKNGQLALPEKELFDDGLNLQAESTTVQKPIAYSHPLGRLDF
jgi:hypothetical protein